MRAGHDFTQPGFEHGEVVSGVAVGRTLRVDILCPHRELVNELNPEVGSRGKYHPVAPTLAGGVVCSCISHLELLARVLNPSH